VQDGGLLGVCQYYPGITKDYRLIELDYLVVTLAINKLSPKGMGP
jgi:hypothetical protein